MNKDILNFKATIIKQRYNSEDYKIYVVSVDSNIYKNVKTNKRNEYILVGNIPSLVPNIEYDIKAKAEINKNYGVQYSVVSVRKDKPSNIESSKRFLEEIITKNQTNTLLEVYPDIIDRVIKNKEVDLSKTKGIKEATFIIIKNKIIDNFALIDLVDKYGGYIPMSTIKKLYDKYGNINAVNKSLQLNPYKCLCSLSRIGFKTADGIVLSLEEYSKNNTNSNIQFKENDIKSSKQRLLACIDYNLSQNEQEGNTKMTISKLREECGKTTPECVHHFVQILKDDNNSFVINKDKTVAFKNTYKTEEYISACVKKFLSCDNIWNINTKLYKKDGNLELTDEQMGVLNNVCKHSLSILTAPAGSGKSQSIKNVINMLEDNNKTYKLMTPTGKSSKVLANYTDRECGTIHRQLKYNPSLMENPWTYNEENKLKEDIIIVDEFSMTDIFLFKHLLEAIDISKTKLLLVYDSFQLPSVGCGNIAQDFLNCENIPRTYLTKIFRYNEGGLMQVVTKVRNGEQFLNQDNLKSVNIFGSKKDFVYMELQQEKMISNVLKIYSKLLKDGYDIEDIAVLSSQNKGNYGTKAINKAIQSALQETKKNYFIMRGEDKFFKDDKVIQIVNNYKAKNEIGEECIEIFNGDTGVVKEIKFNKMLVQYGDKIVQYEKDDLDQIELGYCTTIHKSQGSSAKQVITLMPKAHNFMLNSNIIYVGWTRAKERVYALACLETINRRIKVKENLDRKTNLSFML